MTLVVLVGGARSGKSTLAVERAAAMVVPTFTGKTASAVARLRPRRPILGLSHHQWAIQQMALEWGITPRWIPETENVEDLWRHATDAARTSGLVDPGDTVIVDCLSLWVANGGNGAVLAPRAGLTIAVTNEVGLGIVPENALARAYRDDLGRVNASWVDAADEAYFVVAGRMLRLS